MRLDSYLCTFLGIESRNKAQQLIRSGGVLVNSVLETKSSRKISPMDVVEQTTSLRFVSRGGHKLEAALQAFSLSIEGYDCIDVGASTGGFTDCMLKHGAHQVFCIDVGQNQLHSSLLRHPQVHSVENTDIRDEFSIPFLSDFLAADLSFISLSVCLNAIKRLMKPYSIGVFLIKPQFEAGLLGYKRDYIPLGEMRNKVIAHCIHNIENSGFSILGTIPSPVSGAKKGNIEELIAVEKQ